jgi:hypothetical protein
MDHMQLEITRPGDIVYLNNCVQAKKVGTSGLGSEEEKKGTGYQTEDTSTLLELGKYVASEKGGRICWRLHHQIELFFGFGHP